MVKQPSFLKFSALSLTLISLLFPTATRAIPVTNAYINFARAGGIFSSRTATFAVPEKDTTALVKEGLRLYEVHFAKMIELTSEYCQDRESNYIVYWNYEAEDRKVFMGQFALSCQFSKDTLKQFGTAATETITIHQAGNPETIKIKALNLNRNNARQFADRVQSIKPACIEGQPRICPGDRLE